MTRISSSSGTRPTISRMARADDRPDRLLLVERRQDQRDRDALLLLELDEAPQVGELGVVEVRFAEPALDAGRDGARFLGGTVGRGEALGLRRELVEGRAADRLARLDDHDGRLGAGGDGLGQRPEQVRVRRRRRRARPRRPSRRGRPSRPRAGWRCGRWAPRAGRPRPCRWRCCLMNAGERALRLGADGHRDARPGRGGGRRPSRRGRCAIASAKRSASSAWGPPRTGTRTRWISRAPRCLTTAMSHGDVADDLVDRRREDGRAVPASRPAGVLPPQPKMMRSASCSADASMMPSAAWRPMRTIGWIVVPSGA